MGCSHHCGRGDRGYASRPLPVTIAESHGAAARDQHRLADRGGRQPGHRGDGYGRESAGERIYLCVRRPPGKHPAVVSGRPGGYQRQRPVDGRDHGSPGIYGEPLGLGGVGVATVVGKRPRDERVTGHPGAADARRRGPPRGSAESDHACASCCAAAQLTRGRFRISRWCAGSRSLSARHPPSTASSAVAMARIHVAMVMAARMPGVSSERRLSRHPAYVARLRAVPVVVVHAADGWPEWLTAFGTLAAGLALPLAFVQLASLRRDRPHTACRTDPNLDITARPAYQNRAGRAQTCHGAAAPTPVSTRVPPSPDIMASSQLRTRAYLADGAASRRHASLCRRAARCTPSRRDEETLTGGGA